MSTHKHEKQLPKEALDDFLKGILEELESPPNPEMLDTARAAFRKKIPLTKRSYAAALLILRAAGVSRTTPKEKAASPAPAHKSVQAPRPISGASASSAALSATTAASSGAGKPEASKKKPERFGLFRSEKALAPVRADPKAKKQKKDPLIRDDSEKSTAYFSIGKRHRVFPNTLIDLILSDPQFSRGEIGRIRIFNNYSFVDFATSKFEALMISMNSKEFMGRRLVVNAAKRKSEMGKEMDN